MTEREQLAQHGGPFYVVSASGSHGYTAGTGYRKFVDLGEAIAHRDALRENGNGVDAEIVVRLR